MREYLLSLFAPLPRCVKQVEISHDGKPFVTVATGKNVFMLKGMEGYFLRIDRDAALDDTDTVTVELDHIDEITIKYRTIVLDCTCPPDNYSDGYKYTVKIHLI